MIDYSKVQALAARTLSEQQIADVLDIDLSTIKSNPTQLIEFREALRKGRAKGEAELRSALYKRARSGDRSAYTELMRREKESS